MGPMIDPRQNATNLAGGTVRDVLPGTWRVMVTVESMTFEAIVTFAAAGTLVEIAAPRPEASLGVWWPAFDDDRGFTYIMDAFVHNNPDPQPALTIRSVEAKNRLTGDDTFEGTATLMIRDPETQAVVSTANPSHTATRIKASAA